MIAEARHTAGKANLATEEPTEPKPEEAKSRKAESQSGEPGFPGDVKIPDTYRSYTAYGQDSNYASNAGTDNA